MYSCSLLVLYLHYEYHVAKSSLFISPEEAWIKQMNSHSGDLKRGRYDTTINRKGGRLAMGFDN